MKPILTEDRVEEVLRDQIKLYEKAIHICKQADLKDILKDSLLALQNQLIELNDGRKT
jgi:hypothetical protein